jgi:hypothetical protein
MYGGECRRLGWSPENASAESPNKVKAQLHQNAGDRSAPTARGSLRACCDCKNARMRDEGKWFELYPNSHPSALIGIPVHRYRSLHEAERAARRMCELNPDLQFIDIMEILVVEGEESLPKTLTRVRPQAP